MVSRRLIRVKTLQVLFSLYTKDDLNFDSALKQYKFSIGKTQELYFLMLKLIVDLKDLHLEKIEINKHKHLPSKEDLNPSLNFSQNRWIRQIEENQQYKRFTHNGSLNWIDNEKLIVQLNKSLQNSPEFKIYQEQESTSYNDDKKIIKFLLENVIGEHPEIIDILEEKSIFWTEDFEFVVNLLLKTARTLKASDNESFLLSSLYKNKDDEQFGYDLLKFNIQYHNDYRQIIESHTKNWEIDRISNTDIILIEMAISELKYMPSIPVKVTMDEYIELAKHYSSEKSRIFINGILDKITIMLKSEGAIQKKGRGLIGQQ
ncbi:MAG: transcription antitermination protein NusB [Bacteroidales bacterium]|nr:transcription antitermination protein NusB [Bacteroidales bacterium]